MGMGKKRKAPNEERKGRLSTSTISSTSNKQKKMWGGSSRRGASSRASRTPNVNEGAITKMFVDIADEDNPEVANMEGLAKLCEHIGIDPEDVRALVLLWKLGANKKPGQITKQEWIQGCIKLEADSIDKFKNIIPKLDPGFITRDEFKSFYKFAFQFNREGKYRTLDKDIVIDLLDLVLKDRVDSHRIQNFAEFLESSKEEANKKINLDQWSSFLDFCYEYENESLDNYDDEMSAWPILIDDFVEFMKNKK